MNASPKQHVLVFVIGLTVQIITETIWALLVNKAISISKIYVITSTQGSNLIEYSLFDEPDARFQAFCHHFDIDQERLFFTKDSIVLLTDEVGLPLQDIRHPKDNLLASNQILSFIKDLSNNPNTVLHASIAGGRKTLSVYLAFAMQLFGRKEDKLYHVLVDPSVENDRNFFYPRSRKEEELIHIAEVPFLRVRKYLPFIEDREFSYPDLISETQNTLDTIAHTDCLELDFKERSIYVADCRITMPPKLFSIYHFFCLMKKNSSNDDITDRFAGFIDLISLSSKDNISKMTDTYKTYYTPASSYHQRIENNPEQGFAQDILRSDISKINRIISQYLPKTIAFLYRINSTHGPYGATRYGISLEKSKIVIKG